MGTKGALILAGGWEGHEPAHCAARFAPFLAAAGFAVEVAESLAVLRDSAKLAALPLDDDTRRMLRATTRNTAVPTI
ncbi:MAG: hypothetical protein M3509_04005, partial [Chloroflexota bacterium]|nr:hypothetical protein [Chloroflexota bacterium]